MDEFATINGELELRASRRTGGRRIRGRFPYRSKAVLSDGGRNGGKPQKEQFEPGAFSYSLKSDAEIHLLSGHDFAKPLASKNTGTLTFHDSNEALQFDADIHPEILDTSYGSDLIKQISSGLVFGLSPGFRIPPPSAVPADKAQKFENEDPKLGRAIIRTIFEAILTELSIVTRPAYPDASVTMHDALGNVINPDDMTDEEKIAAGWTYNVAGILIPPPDTIKRAMPAALRWR
ncbi:prohead peptidase, Unknown type peptidase, MEROPS family U35 [Nitrobacter hamburgensis X14]|uniref:Prohead serine protease domain-containing protein n=1 Tax=Nitrobacter hamburgensis (strain DSM 10229 / NCIMB 13809 / X14) TaxID=323097 RepID=Q1QLF1_NITHX|nr:HK97 family phage prohead protease [Nitrobacter hamburgensis]ABE62946.1 prohead peptidase, Unknown type peptidase, MEROPS family U35 [Nitrobacter hamburgensis X14]